jgi:17beta-estradiol 17-dehydrogenase / very-long-chain 3-oxoacyl-CoA reductase
MDVSTGYWTHGIQYFFMSMVPVWVRTYIGGHLNKSFRQDYFASQAKQEINAKLK